MAKIWESMGNAVGVAPNTARNWTFGAAALGALALISPRKTLAGAAGAVSGGGFGALKGAAIGFFGGGGLTTALIIGLGFATAGGITAPLVVGAAILGLVGGVFGAGKGAIWGAAIGGVDGVLKGVRKENGVQVDSAEAARDNAKLEFQREQAAYQQTAQALGYLPPQPNPFASFNNDQATTGHAASVAESRAQLTHIGRERMN